MDWPRPLLFGHRGAPATGLPENTMASFERALADGATALETDAHETRDGHVVVAHDPVQQGLVIAASSLAELRALDLGGGERMPLLREVLDRFSSVPVNVDLKQRDPPMERRALEVIGPDAERVLLASFHGRVLDRVRALGYRGPTGLSRNEVALVATAPAVVARRFVRGGRAQVPLSAGRLRFDTRAFVERCHALGVRVDYWVVNDVDEARRLLALGADGVMSDAPGVVRPAFAD